MASDAQIAANRRNATLSTGPRTQAGRARSARNATKSGIYAKAEIIPGEDPAELDALKSQYYDSLQPVGHETDLVDQAIRAGWQLRRLARAEADVWTRHHHLDRENSHKKGLPENQHVLACAIERCEEFNSIYRFQAATARILNRSLETLLRLRKAGPLLNTPEFDETNPIADSPVPSPQPPLPDPQPSAETNPIPVPPPAEGPVTDPAPLLLDPRSEAATPQAPNPSLCAEGPSSAETNPIPVPLPTRAPVTDPRSPAPDPRGKAANRQPVLASLQQRVKDGTRG